MTVSDRKHHPKPGRPKGVWYGVSVLFEGYDWNLDIWLVDKNEQLSHHTSDLHRRMLNITDGQRKEILLLKYQALKKGSKEKGLTSATIYKQILQI